jgi:carbonic anhydrase
VSTADGGQRSLRATVEWSDALLTEEERTRLVVVMGHSSCGAIEATLEAVLGNAGPASRNLMSIVDRVRPSIESLVSTDLVNDPVRLRREAMRANVRASVSHLRHSSDIVERLIDRAGLVVVGAELDLTTGEVGFFDGIPKDAPG